MSETKLFLLSPAHCGGKRAAMLLRREADFDLALRVHGPEGAPLGEVFSFVSGLYFRGKLAYAGEFGRPPAGMPASLVITPGRGLVDPTMPVGAADIREFASVPVDLRDRRYREPLIADVERLGRAVSPSTRVVLLGSIATTKYVEVLLGVFGGRLCFPRAFIGMGDMQRGALMLKAVGAGEELPYVSAEGATRSLAGRPGRRA